MSDLLWALIRKLGFSAAVIFGVSVVILVLSRAVPGDAIDQISDGPEERAVLEAELGLDRSFAEQFVSWWRRVAHMDFGASWVMRQGSDVRSLIAPAFRKTALLVVPALLMSLGVAAMLIAIGRWERFGFLWGSIRRLAHLVSVMPLFLMGYLIILAFNGPTYAMIEAGWIERPDWFALPGEMTWHKYALAICVLAVGNGTLSDVLLHLEAEVDAIMRQEYILSARARGVGVYSHALRNLVVPVVSIMINKAGFFLGGVVVVEYVFNIHGLGMMIWNAANLRDIPVVAAIAFVVSVLVTLLHLGVDLLQLAIDPRVRDRREDAGAQ